MSLPLLDRYILSNTVRPTLQLLIGLIVIYTGFTVSIALALVVSGNIPIAQLGWYLLARDLIALEVILPTSAFLGIVIGLTRLHRDREAYAFYAAGVSGAQLTRSVLLFAVLLAVLVALLSIYGRPWSYQQSDTILSSAEVMSFAALPPRTFNRLDDNLIIYARRVDRKTGYLNEVFMNRTLPGETRVVRSQQAHLSGLSNGHQSLELIDGVEYRISNTDAADRVLRFDKLSYLLPPPSVDVVETRRKARPTALLALSEAPKDVAELQWRLMLPWVALLFPLLAVRLGRVATGQVGYAPIWQALLVFLMVFVLASILRAAVENEQLSRVPGLFGVPMAMLLGYAVVLAFERRRVRP